MESLKQNKNIIYNIILFMCLLLICYFFPYTHDDWAWGTEIGIDRLNSLFNNYNGRWAGNIFVIILTRFRILRAVIESVILVLISFFSKKVIFGNETKHSYIIDIFLLMMPVGIFAQSIAWTAGFSNYIPPVLIVLVYIYINRNVISGDLQSINNKLIIPLFILGFIGSLFIENITIYNIFLCIYILIREYLIRKKISLSNIFYMIGSIFGTILMFSNSAYRNIANATDNYRTVKSGNIIVRAIKTFFGNFNNLLIQSNTIINVVICICMMLLIYKLLKKENVQKIKKLILKLIFNFFVLFSTYIIFIKFVGNSNVFITLRIKTIIEGMFSIIFIMSIIFVILVCISNRNQKNRLLFEIFSIIMQAAPLLIVTPIGPRCFLGTYVFFAIFTCDLLYSIFRDKISVIEGIAKKGIILVITFFMLIYGYVYYIDFQRNKYIDNNLSLETLYLPELPYEKYMQYPNPSNDIFEDRFKLFNNINKKTNTIFISYKQWKKIKK